MTTPPAAHGRLDASPLELPARPLVSIVIPCLNEEHYITALLDSLAAQDYGADGIEVLVSDGGSTDRTRELVREYPSRFARLELVDNPRRITVAGLNEGMAASRGDCWIIIGAHSKVRADFVRESVDALRRTGAACVGGPIETIGEGVAGLAIAAAMSSPFGVGNAKFRYAEEEGEVDTVPFGCYHRKVWDVVGQFDETVDGADEDSYNQRLIDAGGKIWLTPAIRSSYYPRRTFKALAKQYWEYGAAKGTLFQRGRPLQPRHFAPTGMVLGGPGLWLLGRFSKRARRLLWLFAGVYLAGGSVMAARAASRNGANPVLTFAAMATMHASYGAGFASGWWRERNSTR
ncbi:glycosyltransferase family 2 protein [Candidatus Amarobacter glycogenicus]|uniref:glycosyltransferase family 2 protein n=1 Tax=Candidatus Amarobacter glycogenicus TaxID=3140699 RepID=UPI003134891E|nr:glycosyltransferase family 2 protein [Dehalococcoidia bacterium]